jgi:hypothetical protein
MTKKATIDKVPERERIARLSGRAEGGAWCVYVDGRRLRGSRQTKSGAIAEYVRVVRGALVQRRAVFVEIIDPDGNVMVSTRMVRR